MKKILQLIVGTLILAPTITFAGLNVNAGGTGLESVASGTVLMGSGSPLRLQAVSTSTLRNMLNISTTTTSVSTSTFGIITATTTNATSSFSGNINVTGNSKLATTTVTSLSISGISTFNKVYVPNLNNTIVVDGFLYPQTTAGIQLAVTACTNNVLCKETYLPCFTATSTSPIIVAKGMKIRGCGQGGTVLKGGFASTGNGIFDFFNASNAMDNMEVSDITFDLSSTTTVALNFVAPVSVIATSTNYYIHDIEIKGKKADPSGLGAIYVQSKNTGTGIQGGFSNLKFERLYIHDGQIVDTTNVLGTSILFKGDAITGLFVKDSTFERVYGTTIAFITSNQRVIHNVQFTGNVFKDTQTINVLTAPSGYGTIAENREGIDQIIISGNIFDTGSYGVHDIYAMQIYNSRDFTVNNNVFKHGQIIIAPGHSYPTGNETESFTFSNNLIQDYYSFGDLDGHRAGIYSHNVFYNMQRGFVFGGYGYHTPSIYDGNLFYKVGQDVDTSADIQTGIFLLEDEGNVVQNNTIYIDLASSTLRYIFVELGAGHGTGQPNTYKNNTIIASSTNWGTLVRTFALDSSFKHNIIGNTGIKESEILNLLGNGVFATSSLSSSDSVLGNYTASGTPLINSTMFNATTTGIFQDKGGAVYNVSAYGAKCDGVTDDINAITATISAMPSQGAILQFPGGTCIVSSYFTPKQQSIVQGSYLGTTIKLKNSSNSAMMVVNQNHVIVRDLFFDGNRANQSSGDGIQIIASFKSIFERVYLTGIKDTSFKFDGSFGVNSLVSIKDSTIYNSGAGILIDALSQDTLLQNVYTENIDATSTRVMGNGTRLYNVHSYRAKVGIETLNEYRTKMVGVIVEGSQQQGILVRNSENPTIIDATVFNNAKNATGTASAVDVQGTTHGGIFNENVIYDDIGTQKYGIVFSNTTYNNYYNLNQITGMASSSILDSSNTNGSLSIGTTTTTAKFTVNGSAFYASSTAGVIYKDTATGLCIKSVMTNGSFATSSATCP